MSAADHEAAIRDEARVYETEQELAARVRLLEEALRPAQEVSRIYEGLRLDANDGTFALWTEDDLVVALHKLGTALAATTAPPELPA